jgi:ADP-glucose pyrophosphorylase
MRVFDFAKDVFPVLVQNGNIGAYYHNGFWTDIGAINDYFDANFYMKDHSFFPLIKNGEQGCVKKENSLISFGAKVLGETYNCIVGNGATVNSGVRMQNCIVLPKTTVRRSYQNCIIGQDFALKI